jgi:hypothetical protein
MSFNQNHNSCIINRFCLEDNTCMKKKNSTGMTEDNVISPEQTN